MLGAIEDPSRTEFTMAPDASPASTKVVKSTASEDDLHDGVDKRSLINDVVDKGPDEIVDGDSGASPKRDLGTEQLDADATQKGPVDELSHGPREGGSNVVTAVPSKFSDEPMVDSIQLMLLQVALHRWWILQMLLQVALGRRWLLHVVLLQAILRWCQGRNLRPGLPYYIHLLLQDHGVPYIHLLDHGRPCIHPLLQRSVLVQQKIRSSFQPTTSR